MKSIRLFTIIFVLILISSTKPTSGQESIVFTSTSFEVKIEGNLVKSNQIQVILTNAPALPEDFSYQITFDDNSVENFDVKGGTIEIHSNVLSIGRVLNLKLIGPTTEVNLATREVNTVTWNHVKHVFANWTFGTNPPPDGRGFGQGAVIDGMILDSILEQNITSQTELVTLSEDIFNLLFGSSVDFNEDNAVKTLSDSWGLYNYSIGMRDHIRNAGNGDTDPTSDLSKLSDTIITNFENIVEEGDPGLVYSNLSISGTVFGRIFQSITHINQNLTEPNLNAATASLKNNVTELTSFIIQYYDEFRSVAFDFKVDISDFIFTVTEGSIDSSSSIDVSISKSDDSPIYFEIVFLSMIFIVVFAGKLLKIKKKV